MINIDGLGDIILGRVCYLFSPGRRAIGRLYGSALPRNFITTKIDSASDALGPYCLKCSLFAGQMTPFQLA
jgi:hypothetical protein